MNNPYQTDKMQPSSPVDPTLKSFLSMMPHDTYIKAQSGEVLFYNGEMDKAAVLQANVTSIEQAVMTSQQAQSDVLLALPNDRYISFDCQPWLLDDGTVGGCVGILRDITAAHYEKKQLTESAHLLQLVVDHLPVRVFWKNNDLVYMGCNTVFANDMGHERLETLVGTDDFNTSMTAPEAEICRADDRFVIDSDEGRYGAEEIIGSDDETMWIRVSKVPLYSADGEKLGVLGMYEDIEEQKKAQIEMEKALHRAEELNRLKTNFISTVSHEYRNPLATITLYVDTMLRFGEKMNVTMRSERLEKIRKEVDLMTLLINDVIFIGQDELTRVEPTYEAIDMEALCQDVIVSLDDVAENSTERICTVYEGNKQPLIGSRPHLIQIVRNLLSNALKYSDDTVDMTLGWTDDKLTLVVEDRGIGIPEQAHSYIFDSFFRSENVDIVKGNGLGLFIAHRAVELHSGTISFDSVEGKGTKFIVTIPLRPLKMPLSSK